MLIENLTLELPDLRAETNSQHVKAETENTEIQEEAAEYASSSCPHGHLRERNYSLADWSSA